MFDSLQIKKFSNLLSLLRSQWKTNDELKTLQLKKLKAIVTYSYNYIPLYRKKYKKAHVHPSDITKLEDLSKFPFITKEEIQLNFPDEILSKNIQLENCWLSRTSGSTGKPLTMVYDRNAENFEKATALRANLSVGHIPNYNWWVVTSPDHMVKKKWFQKMGIFNINYISLYDEPTIQLSTIHDKVDVLDGYASSIYLMAEAINDFSYKINPKMIFTTAEILTDDMRSSIIKNFNVNPFDQYGCVEMGRTAWECEEHNGFHIDMEAVLMEFIKDGKNVNYNEEGEIVYTNLYNYAMPLIRYKINDVGIPSDEQCNCGRGLSLMKKVIGRSDAYIKNMHGRLFSPIIWTILLRPFNIKQYRVIQKNIAYIQIEIVCYEKVDINLELMKDAIKKIIGSEMKIDIIKKTTIDRENSGKIRSVLSEI